MPEEVNRLLTDQVSTLLFAPTETAVSNLKREGIADHRVQLVGDVMYDAALYYWSQAEQSSILERLGVREKEYALITVHRAANTDNAARLRAITDALCVLADDIPVIFPLHPRTRNALAREDLLQKLSRVVRVINPLGFLDMIRLEKHSRLIVTDSGGVQKESFFYRVPCVTVRDTTEWVELIDLGWLRLVPPVSSKAVLEACRQALTTPAGREGSPYGDGRAAVHIAELFRKTEFRPSNEEVAHA
jgi:UDP-GlcNAc3NAcA epimerase